MIILLLIGANLFLFWILVGLTYFLQLKDYKIYRVRAHLHDLGLVRTINGFLGRRPKLSIRNILIVGGTFIGIVIITIVGILNAIYLDTLELFILEIALLGLVKILYVAILVVTEIIAVVKMMRLLNLAEKKAKSSKAIFIGITGSYGKSSVKEFLINVLSKKYKVAGTIENYNSEIGLAISILRQLNEDTEVFVAEIASYGVGEILKATRLVNLKYGVLTALGNQHMDLFGTKERLWNAKSELISSVEADGKVFINMDCEGWDIAASRSRARVFRYSMNNGEADIYVAKSSAIKSDVGGFTFLYKNAITGVEEKFKVYLAGDHNILNLLPVIAISLDLGVEIASIKEALEELRPITGKLSKHEIQIGKKRLLVLNDSYNSSLHGFVAALQVLANTNGKSKVAFTKGLFELGDEKIDSYRIVTKEAEKLGIEIVTVDPDWGKNIKSLSVKVVDSEKEMVAELRNRLEDSTLDVALLEGRFGVEILKLVGLVK